MTFQISALIILAAFYGCYFGKMLLQRRRGIQTDQIGKGKTGAARTIELTMKAATLLVPLVELVSILLGAAPLPFGVRCVGAVLALLGDAAFLVSVWTMRDSWRAGVSETDKTELVTSGIYRFSRNPAFLGFDLVYLGVLLMFFNWLLLAASLFASVMFHIQIARVEEPFLDRVFGADYAVYKRTVNRYFGRH